MQEHHFTNKIVKIFLESNLSLILILLATIVGLAALWLTPREEDPQIVVPLADVYVNFPGHSAAEVEQLVATPLEKILYQIDGVEYVYSMSREDQAIITVRYYVGEDRERSLVKLYKKIDENLDVVPPGVTGWVVKPVEIDDVPVVTLTLASQSADDMTLRRVAEELAQRLAGVQDVSRAYVVGGRPRVVQVLMDPDRMAAYHVSPLELQRAIQGANVRQTAGDFRTGDRLIRVEAGEPFEDARAIARSGRRRVRRPAGVSQGCGPGRGRAGGSRQLRAPRLGTGAWVHEARVLPRHDFGRVGACRCKFDRKRRCSAGRDHRDRQEKGLQRRLGGRCRAAAGRRTATEDRAERHGTDCHPQLRSDGQREGQRTGRRIGRGHLDCRGAC